jgi:hypothetical protein
MRVWAQRIAMDALMPLAVLMGVSIAVMGEGWTRMHSVIIGGGNPTTPSDVNGTLWFYWWVTQSMERGVDLLRPDVICAPTGQSLGSNFPQHIDALMAAPFLNHLPFPAAFNTFVVLIPVLGGIAAYAGARWLGLGRALALMVALLFGFNSLSLHELANGKPPSALVFTLPLFVCAWIKALTARGRPAAGWAAVAGIAAALAIQHYVLYALIAAFFAAGSLLLFAIRPAPEVGRRRAWLAGALVVLIGLTLSAPYLQRLLGERRPMPVAMAPKLTDPSILREQAESIHVGYIFGADQDEDLPRRAAFPVVLTVTALVLVPFGGRRHRRWLAAAAGFYLLSLGPMAASSVRPEVEWLTIAGRGVPLPTWWLNQAFPFSIQFFHPCRVFPMVVLCASMSVATGLQHALRNFDRRWLAPLAALIIAGTGLWHVDAQGGTRILTTDWEPHPFLESLAESSDDGALIEFPVGLGHATAAAQLVHERRRSESHHDAIAALKANQRPEDCLQSDIFDSLWPLSQGDLTAAPTEAQVNAAVADGFSHLVLWRSGFDVLHQAGIDADRERTIRVLRVSLGTPVVADDEIVVWKLKQ